MGPMQLLILALISTLSSAGASPTPGLISILLLSWGAVFPGAPVPEEIAFLAAVDWLIDRCVTTTNITGDSFVTRIVNHWTPVPAPPEVAAAHSERSLQMSGSVRSMKEMQEVLEADPQHAPHLSLNDEVAA